MTSGILISTSLNLPDSREMGGEAVFTLSSAKPGNGVECLRDDSTETYWQSDGTVPHVISIHFMERKSVSYLCLYLDFGLDESYSAKKINVKAGTIAHDLVDVITFELNEPTGWVIIQLHDPYNKEIPLKAHLVQLRVLAMHQNGRDTHLRQIKIFGPRSTSENLPFSVKLQSSSFMQFNQLR